MEQSTPQQCNRCPTAVRAVFSLCHDSKCAYVHQLEQHMDRRSRDSFRTSVPNDDHSPVSFGKRCQLVTTSPSSSFYRLPPLSIALATNGVMWGSNVGLRLSLAPPGCRPAWRVAASGSEFNRPGHFRLASTFGPPRDELQKLTSQIVHAGYTLQLLLVPLSVPLSPLPA